MVSNRASSDIPRSRQLSYITSKPVLCSLSQSSYSALPSSTSPLSKLTFHLTNHARHQEPPNLPSSVPSSNPKRSVTPLPPSLLYNQLTHTLTLTLTSLTLTLTPNTSAPIPSRSPPRLLHLPHRRLPHCPTNPTVLQPSRRQRTIIVASSSGQ